MSDEEAQPDRLLKAAQAGDPLADKVWADIRQTVRARCEETFWKKLEIVPAALHNDAGIIGPATLPLESEFRQGVKGRPR